MAKLGKGYRDNKPIGIVAGRCDECGGDIIALQMCTSKRGFSVSSEKVCKDCGLLAPQSFILDHPVLDRPKYRPKQIIEYTTEIEYETLYKWWITNIEPYKDFKVYISYKARTIMCKQSYHTLRIPSLKGNINPDTTEETNTEDIYYNSHEEWYNDNSPVGTEYEGIDTLYEYKLQIAGERPGPRTDSSYRETSNKSTGRLKSAIAREKRVGAMRNTPMKIYRELQYKELINDYRYELELNSIQIEEVEYIIKNNENILNIQQFKADDIVYCLCLYQTLKDKSYRSVNAFFARSIRNSIVTTDMKRLYSLIVQKMNG